MRPADSIAKLVKQLRYEADADARDRVLVNVLRVLEKSKEQKSAEIQPNVWRIIMKSKMTKLSAAAVMVLVALVLWRTVGVTSNAYGISDVPALIDQARTVHVKSTYFHGENKASREYWVDLENGRFYHYWEGNPYKGENGWDFMTVSQTVSDGQYIMKIDHKRKSVRFEKLLSSQRYLQRLIIADNALNMMLEGKRHLQSYTKVGEGEINGQEFDIWQRELQDTESPVGFKYESWVCPATGDVGLTRRWYKADRSSSTWILLSETEKIEKDTEPPANIFSTNPPQDYALENSKATAKIVGVGFEPFKYKGGYEINVPASFILEDGSVLACWRGENQSVVTESDEVFGQLKMGGDLPQTPIAVYGLILPPVMDGQDSFIHYIGRHMAYTRKADKIYEWALYVPEHQVVEHDPTEASFAAVLRFNSHDPNIPERMPLRPLMSHVVAPETFNKYVREAVLELSENGTVPEGMDYTSILQLARHIRSKRELYDRYRNELSRDSRLENFAQFKQVEIVLPSETAQQVKRVVGEFFTAIVNGHADDAMKLLRYEEPRASRVVAGMKQLPGLADMEVEDVYADDRHALVISSEFRTLEGKSIRWAIGLIREKGTWLIKDFDPTTTETMSKEIDQFLQHFPDAQHFFEK